jgi:hypothetical protein
LGIIDDAAITQEAKDELKKKADGLNQPSQKILNERFFASLNLEMGKRELAAWARRNDSAHGNVTPSDQTSRFIKDTHLMTNILNRVILRMAGVGGCYIDYFSPNYPKRALHQPADD